MAKVALDAVVPLKELTRGIRKYNRWANVRGIESAYAFAERVHRERVRASGAPVFSHPTQVADILVELRMDAATITAGLLHDTLEDTDTTYRDLQDTFGEEVADLVEGVTKISQVKHRSSAEARAETLRKMIVATARDIRVLIIKLSDRLHNMRTIEYLPSEKVQRICRESMDIYAPLAHRLGMGQIKGELEDIAFRQLDAHAHQELAKLIALDRHGREQLVESYCEQCTKALKKAKVRAEVTGRPKHLYSIHEKMLRQRKAFEDITDLHGLRVLVPSIQDCYHALGTIHTIWTPVPARFKDYIAVPKMNMYQSLHTTVVAEGGQRLEVQIRTHDMNRTSELGIAAHWRYKEGRADDEDEFDRRMQWLRQLLEWQQEARDPREFMEQLKTDLFLSSVYVFTPKGRVVELPHGATPIDFAFTIHTEVGLHCTGAKINSRLVPLRSVLEQGDEVEILTSPKQHPKHDWLEWVKTSAARSKIRRYIRQQQERAGGHDAESKPEAKPAAAAAVPPPGEEPRHIPRSSSRRVQDESHGVVVDGAHGFLVRFAKCCNPLPGERIVGYITRNRGVSVHRETCQSLTELHRGDGEARMIAVSWTGDAERFYEVAIRACGADRPNLLSDVLSVVGDRNLNVTACNAYRGKTALDATFDLLIEVENHTQLEQLIDALRRVPGITSAERSSTVPPHPSAN